MGVRKSPAFGRGRGGGRGQVGEWPPRPQAPNLARLFSPGCSLPGPDSRLTCLGPNLPSTLPRSPPSPGALGFLPARGLCSRHAEEGWHFLAGPRAASLAPGRSDSADRQAPDAISGGALLSAQFPFFHRPSETGQGRRV